MTWTFYSTLLTSTSSTAADLMRVRYLVADTSTGDQLVSDEEIYWTLSQYPNLFEAAGVVAGAIATNFARQADSKTVSGLTLSWSKRSDGYSARAKQLDRMGKNPNNRTIQIFAGGISQADKDTQWDDTDWAKPNFWLGMHDNPPVYPIGSTST